MLCQERHLCTGVWVASTEEERDVDGDDDESIGMASFVALL